jgi:DNA-binding response OmpR family regulator
MSFMALPLDGTLETILLVEGRPALLKLVKQILEDAKFTVIAASSTKQAIRLEAEFPGTIDLMLGDMRTTGMSGPNLAKRLKERRPQMRVVLMAGYPGGALLVLNYGWHYIEKPFVASVLVNRIKDVLRGETREQTTDRFDTLKVPRRSFGRVSLGFPTAHPWRARQRA